ncbi:hypothetical protein [Thiolapillus sp.]|uniref:hypothetical protein n=1 Tax=Thiolapillus sp. TaxID=2017437 RepID=UPI003AF8A24E
MMNRDATGINQQPVEKPKQRDQGANEQFFPPSRHLLSSMGIPLYPGVRPCLFS